MEYASGGELFERICNAGRFSEDEVLSNVTFIHLCNATAYAFNLCNSMLQARFFFQQLISGVSYCHAMVLEFTTCSLLFYSNDTFTTCSSIQSVIDDMKKDYSRHFHKLVQVLSKKI